MKRTTTILIAICVSALFANGKQISQNAALSAARKYSRTGQVAPAKNLRSDKTNNAPYYAFNLEQGYVIVSGDDEMTELVGYAENGFFDAENVPPQMQLWLDGYAEYVAAVQSGKAKARKFCSPTRRRLWWSLWSPPNGTRMRHSTTSLRNTLTTTTTRSDAQRDAQLQRWRR